MPTAAPWKGDHVHLPTILNLAYTRSNRPHEAPEVPNRGEQFLTLWGLTRLTHQSSDSAEGRGVFLEALSCSVTSYCIHTGSTGMLTRMPCEFTRSEITKPWRPRASNRRLDTESCLYRSVLLAGYAKLTRFRSNRCAVKTARQQAHCSTRSSHWPALSRRDMSQILVGEVFKQVHELLLVDFSR